MVDERLVTVAVVACLESADEPALLAASKTCAGYELGRLPTLTVSGNDRKTWLNGLLTCDVAAVASGRAQWGLLLNRLGKIQAVLAILEQAEQLWVVVLWGDAQAVASELDARLVMEDAELVVSSEPIRWMLLVGPDARLAAPRSDSAVSGSIELVGANVLVGWVDGAGPDVPLLSDAGWMLIRAQHGLPWGGVDFSTSERPHDAALDRKAVSWSKGCYLGQEVVCMQDMRGKVKRSIRAFSGHQPRAQVACGAPSDALAYELNAELHTNSGQSLGRVSTAVYDPNGERWWVLASVALESLAATGDDPVAQWSPRAGQLVQLQPGSA